MRLRRERGLAHLAPRAHDGVGLLAADGDGVVHEVGDAEEDVVDLALHLAQPRVDLADALADGAHLGDQMVGALLRALALGHGLRRGVAARLQLVALADQGAALGVDLHHPRHRAVGLRRVPAAGQRGAEGAGVLPDLPEVEHQAASRSSSQVWLLTTRSVSVPESGCTASTRRIAYLDAVPHTGRVCTK